MMPEEVRLAMLLAALTLFAYLAVVAAVAMTHTGWLGLAYVLVVALVGRTGLAQVNR